MCVHAGSTCPDQADLGLIGGAGGRGIGGGSVGFHSQPPDRGVAMTKTKLSGVTREWLCVCAVPEML